MNTHEYFLPEPIDPVAIEDNSGDFSFSHSQIVVLISIALFLLLNQ